MQTQTSCGANLQFIQDATGYSIRSAVRDIDAIDPGEDSGTDLLYLRIVKCILRRLFQGFTITSSLHREAYKYCTNTWTVNIPPCLYDAY